MILKHLQLTLTTGGEEYNLVGRMFRFVKTIHLSKYIYDRVEPADYLIKNDRNLLEGDLVE